MSTVHPRRRPTTDELDGALFAPEQPALVLGDPGVGVVATVETDDGSHVRLLAVDPGARGRGHGHALLEAAEVAARAGGGRSLTVGADAPYYLWPGVPTSATAMLCLLERRHYSRVDTNFDMTVELGALPDDPGGHVVATADDRAEIDAWTAAHWPNWRLEVLRALDKGNLVVARDDGAPDGDVAAFCAFEVNRAGMLGPVAVRPDLLGHGQGRASAPGGTARAAPARLEPGGRGVGGPGPPLCRCRWQREQGVLRLPTGPAVKRHPP